jgi:3,4-dihydroxy 2-butanone 4-phosphate synthase / GTP cyclohydrolase II
MDDAQQRIRSAIGAFARGELVIVADDDDRESEGDLFVAASLCTPEKMAFVIRHTSGIVCAPLTPVCTENSNPNIMVMQSAKDRVGMDTSSSLNWARKRRVLI